jgi:hypothetical protein
MFRRKQRVKVDYWVFASIKSVLFFGMFFVDIYLLIPKTVQAWRLWKKTGKSIYLSAAAAGGSVAFCVLLGNLLIFLQAVWRMHV